CVQPQERELRQPGTKGHLIGAENCDGSNYLASLPDLPDGAREAVRGEKIVDPRLRVWENGVFKTLSLALGAAEPGDVIRIRFDGELAVEPTLLDKDVTLCPFKDCNPILVLSA